MVEMDREVKRLFESFPDGYITADWEFVVGASEDVSVPLESVSDKWDSAKLLLMFASSDAYNGKPYWDIFRNFRYRQRLRAGINDFCTTSFNREDFGLIADCIGDCHNMALAEKFVTHGCKMSILRRYVSEYGDDGERG